MGDDSEQRQEIVVLCCLNPDVAITLIPGILY